MQEGAEFSGVQGRGREDGDRVVPGVAEVAREIQVGTLGNWVNKYRVEHADEEPPLSVSDRARLRELEREIRELRMKSGVSGKSGGLLRPGVSVSAKYEFIDAQKAQYAIVKMCRWLGVSTSGSTSGATGRPRRPRAAGSDSPPSSSGSTTTRTEHTGIAASTPRWSARASGAARSSCGRSCASWAWCRASLGRSDRRPPWPAARRRRPTWSGRDFSADAPGTKLVGDITYIPTWQGWLYLASVIDCCTKECIGYALADHMRADLVIDALQMAARNHTLADGAIFHSDRGTQYTCEAFARAAAELDIRRSVGRTGSCFDNAQAESFNAALKVERVNRTVYPTREHARADVARYIEFRYNSKRLHSALGYRTPKEVHNEFLNHPPGSMRLTTNQLSGKRGAAQAVHRRSPKAGYTQSQPARLADQGELGDPQQALLTARTWAEEELRAGHRQVEDYLKDGGPFPDRLHLIAPFAELFADLIDAVERWADRTQEEISTWRSTRGLGMTLGARRTFERALALRPDLADVGADAGE